MSAKAVILERGTTSDGFPVRLQQRGAKFDVVRYSGVTWRYVDKAVSEDRAKNTFDALMLKPAKNPARPRASKRETATNPTGTPMRRLGYGVIVDFKGKDQLLGVFSESRDAKSFAQAVADTINSPLRVVSGAYVFTPDK